MLWWTASTGNYLACVQSRFSHVQLFVTLLTLARQAPLSMDSPGKNTGVCCDVSWITGRFLTAEPPGKSWNTTTVSVYGLWIYFNSFSFFKKKVKFLNLLLLESFQRVCIYIVSHLILIKVLLLSSNKWWNRGQEKLKWFFPGHTVLWEPKSNCFPSYCIKLAFEGLLCKEAAIVKLLIGQTGRERAMWTQNISWILGWYIKYLLQKQLFIYF